MDIGKLTYYSRKIHRFSLLFVVVLGLIQMTTGLIMRYPNLLPFVDQISARFLHYQTATYFSIAFGVQMITGLIMYLAPWLLKRFMRPTPPPTKLPN